MTFTLTKRGLDVLKMRLDSAAGKSAACARAKTVLERHKLSPWPSPFIPSPSYNETWHRMPPLEAREEYGWIPPAEARERYEEWIYDAYGAPMEYEVWGLPKEETGYDWNGNRVVWDHYQDEWTLPPAEAREEYEEIDEYHDYYDEDEGLGFRPPGSAIARPTEGKLWGSTEGDGETTCDPEGGASIPALAICDSHASSYVSGRCNGAYLWGQNFEQVETARGDRTIFGEFPYMEGLHEHSTAGSSNVKAVLPGSDDLCSGAISAREHGTQVDAEWPQVAACGQMSPNIKAVQAGSDDLGMPLCMQWPILQWMTLPDIHMWVISGQILLNVNMMQAGSDNLHM
ncbi:hypothetical protein EDB89DRAFT_1907812 [Lactarius sanguifluus]|nr:hypothetical protein EDB89DRAFT_1907812 [Lactarius sanguifluus]